VAIYERLHHLCQASVVTPAHNGSSLDDIIDHLSHLALRVGRRLAIIIGEVLHINQGPKVVLSEVHWRVTTLENLTKDAGPTDEVLRIILV
jgi:hypothetical protein